jgi:hypothetical protein
MNSPAEQLAAPYNASLRRTDVEWAVGNAGNVYLRDREGFTAGNTRAIAQRQERERQIWLANYRRMQREAAEL